MAQVVDIQSGGPTIANDNTQRVISAFMVPARSIFAATFYRVQVVGTLSTAIVLPGTVTFRFSFGGTVATVINETLLAGVAGSQMVSYLDAWLVPGATATTVCLSGMVMQNSGDMFIPSGPRGAVVVSTTENFGVNNLLQATWQFGTASASNIFTRVLASTRLVA